MDCKSAKCFCLSESDTRAAKQWRPGEVIQLSSFPLKGDNTLGKSSCWILSGSLKRPHWGSHPADFLLFLWKRIILGKLSSFQPFSWFTCPSHTIQLHLTIWEITQITEMRQWLTLSHTSVVHFLPLNRENTFHCIFLLLYLFFFHMDVHNYLLLANLLSVYFNKSMVILYRTSDYHGCSFNCPSKVEYMHSIMV